jgi:hypothetical protein
MSYGEEVCTELVPARNFGTEIANQECYYQENLSEEDRH